MRRSREGDSATAPARQLGIEQIESFDNSVAAEKCTELGQVAARLTPGDLPIVRRYFRQVLRAEPPNKVVQIIPDLRALAASCAAGLGLTVLPSYLCATQLREGTLVRLDEPTRDIPCLEPSRTAAATPRLQAGTAA